MKNKTTYLTGAGAIFGIFATMLIGSMFGTGGRTQKAEAAWSPEALQIVESIKASSAEYNAAGEKIDAARAIIDAETKTQQRSAAAAKGADLTLCAKFQARYDRTTQQLVTDENCPLL